MRAAMAVLDDVPMGFLKVAVVATCLVLWVQYGKQLF